MIIRRKKKHKKTSFFYSLNEPSFFELGFVPYSGRARRFRFSKKRK